MPQATTELSERWDGPSDEKAMKHLEDRGYKLLKGFVWQIPPHIETPSEVDDSAVDFLIQEWDFGGYA